MLAIWPHFFWDPNSTWSGFWGGFGGNLTYFAIFGVAYAKLRCHVTGCKRLGLHPVNGTAYHVCRRHHPERETTAAHIAGAHEAAKHR